MLTLNQQERILALVKQGVISTEEALILLENHQKYTQEQDSAFIEEATQMKANIAKENEKIESLESLELIAPLTEEQIQDLTQAKARKKDYETTLEQIEVTGKVTMPQEDSKERMKEVGRKVESFVQNTSKKMMKLVKHTTTQYQSRIKEKNSIQPKKFEAIYYYAANNLKQIAVTLGAGHVTISQSPESQVRIEVNATVYMDNEEWQDPEAFFLEEALMDIRNNVLEIQLPIRTVKADLMIYLPEKVYDDIVIKMQSGVVQLENLDTDQLFVKMNHGNTRLTRVTAKELSLMVTNGNIKAWQVTSPKLVVNVSNGILDMESNSDDIQLKMANGPISYQALNNDLNILMASTNNGDIHLSIPQALEMQVDALAKVGDVQYKGAMVELQENEETRTGRHMRFLTTTGERPARIELRTKTGAINIKRIESEV